MGSNVVEIMLERRIGVHRLCFHMVSTVLELSRFARWNWRGSVRQGRGGQKAGRRRAGENRKTNVSVSESPE